MGSFHLNGTNGRWFYFHNFFSLQMKFKVFFIKVLFTNSSGSLIPSSDVTLTLDPYQLTLMFLFWEQLLKVDMFSYGMVMYELLSGRRPALGHHQLEIAKKLSKGIRPVLGSPQEVQFCCLHNLMTECWDTKPEKVSCCLADTMSTFLLCDVRKVYYTLLRVSK